MLALLYRKRMKSDDYAIIIRKNQACQSNNHSSLFIIIMAVRPLLTDLIQFLANPNSYSEATTVTLIQTHISVVALTDRFVYKLKKPVRFDFLDFSSLEQRLFYCREEIQLNGRLSADLYLGILPIHYNGQSLSFNPDGPIVDYLIQMRRLTDEGLLINQIRLPHFPLHCLDRLAHRLITFYQNAPPQTAPFGTAATVLATVKEVTNALPITDEQSLHSLTTRWIKYYLFAFPQIYGKVFDQRIRAGKIVEGHGDLRSEHIHIEKDMVTIYDCIEFSQKLRCVDWLDDIAFLLMDLDYRHTHNIAERLESNLLTALEREDVQPLLTFYKTYRACVRGKVNRLKAAEPEVEPLGQTESQRKAERYDQLALRYTLLGSKPTVVVCMGGVATGKSTLADALSQLVGLTTISSDVVRKHLFGLDPLTRLPDNSRSALYSASVTERVYQELNKLAAAAINRDGAVVLDATFRQERHLRSLQNYCRKNRVRLLVIQTTTPSELIVQRLRMRETVPTQSDMRLSDYQSALFEPLYAVETVVESMLTVDTRASIPDILERTLFPWLSRQTFTLTELLDQ